MSGSIERVESDNQLLAIVIRREFNDSGINFFTPNEFSQQLAFMSHPKNTEIDAHVHNRVLREVEYTQEVLFIRRGRLRVDFYSEKHEYLHSRVLRAGDVILLASGGHGFKVLEDVEMIEVKQGPYGGQNDKRRIESVASDQLKVHGITTED